MTVFDLHIQDGKCKKREGFPAVVIVILVVIICGLLAAVASWVLYAYRHPTSRSGIWLMEVLSCANRVLYLAVLILSCT